MATYLPTDLPSPSSYLPFNSSYRPTWHPAQTDRRWKASLCLGRGVAALAAAAAAATATAALALCLRRCCLTGSLVISSLCSDSLPIDRPLGWTIVGFVCTCGFCRWVVRHLEAPPLDW